MKVTVRVSPFAPLPEVLDFTHRVEAAGFDGIGYLDSQMINRDLWVTMGAAAATTERLRLVAAVTNPLSRHISVTASSAASVDDLAPGRVEVWIGRGFSAVNMAGLHEATTPEMRTSIQQYRRLMAGEWDVFPGAHSQLRISGRNAPIYLAAAGPRTMRLAGEVADGILAANGFTSRAMEEAQSLIAEGAKSAGRDPSEIDFCLQALTCIRETREEALRWAGPLLVLKLEDEPWLKAEGIDSKGIHAPPEFHALYPEPQHAHDPERARELAAQVPEELRMMIAEKTGFIGKAEDVIAGMKRVSEAGIRYVFMRTIDTLSFPTDEVDIYGAKIREAVAALP
jgi:5,10-methylenetetrahydromethanopterin reductase